ncbi:MAG: molybdopterin-dependent oxidoreductase [Chloroflexota bacterium]
MTITLDGREVSADAGTTILNLARESGIKIPTLCHDPRLSSPGACRLCIVEEEKTGALMASCVTAITPGMVINTHSARVMEHRKTIVKLMLASHPDTCLVCDKGNRCQLRQIASDMGIGLVDFQRLPLIADIQEINPFIRRDLSKCILCARCIRACQELVVQGAVDYLGRGFSSKPATLGDAPLDRSECTFCGVCLSVCPTGSLTEVGWTGGTTGQSVPTTCPFCGCGCSISLEVKDNQVVRATPAMEGGANHGTLCVRGSFGWDFIHSPDRLTRPLVKSNGKFIETTWEQALETAAGQLARIAAEDGGARLAVLGSSKCTNEENYLLQRFARFVLGTNNVDNGGSLYSSATRVGLSSSIGFAGSTNRLDELEQAEVIIVAGCDPTSSAPSVGYAIKRAVKFRGAVLVVVDPRLTGLAPFARLWLRPRPGTDLALLNAMARMIVDEGLLDEEFVARKTDNFEAFKAALLRLNPESVEPITGIPHRDIQDGARLFAAAGQAAIVYGSGITQYPNGTDTVKALANLALLTGNVRRKGGGIYPLQRENNAQGAADMGMLPDFLPGYQDLRDVTIRRKFEERWNTPLPAVPGVTAVEMLELARQGTIKGLYVVGENPILSFPNSRQTRDSLTALDFMVVQDMFLTETAKLAHVVLPAVSFAEKDGTFTNFEGRVCPVRRSVGPAGQSLPDWQIIIRLSQKMGRPMPFSSLQQVSDEIEELVPFYQGYSGLEAPYVDEPGLKEARRTYGGPFVKGFARFSPVEYVPPPEPALDGYPFTLLTGTVLYRFGSGTRSSNARRLKKFYSEAFVEINTADAAGLGLRDGDRARIMSRAGDVTAAVRTSDALPPRAVFMPISFPEAPAANLFEVVLDRQSKSPAFKSCAVRIERMKPDG